MAYAEDSLLPISAIQHIAFCPRQCGLIHLDQSWAENQLTVEGQLLHRKTHNAHPQTFDGKRIIRSMDLRSFRLGLVGKSDVVEFIPPEGVSPREAHRLVSHLTGNTSLNGWIIVPVEYKRGKPKTHPTWGDCDRVQLCAQGLCIEEMLGIELENGQLFYGEKRHRIDVEFSNSLRCRTEQLVGDLRQLIESKRLPPAVNDRRCRRCSLKEICMPQQTQAGRNAGRWIAKQLEENRKLDL